MRAVNKRLGALMLGAALAVASATAAFAGSASAVLGPASPPHYVGPCPGVIKFSGYVTSLVPGVVKYQWFRSDGATGPVQTLTFREKGRLPISTTWTLGGIPALPSYAGWEAVHVLSPAGADSNKAMFTLKCVKGPLTHG
jgi:hypothetical protein